MSFTYGFYNSKGGDRKYNAEQMSSIFDGIINDGIFANVGRVFATIPGEGLQIVVGSGRAWFNSTWSYNDAAFPIALDPADPIQSRIDSVILEVDRTETVRRNRLLVLTGSPSSSPNPPVLKNTDLVHQHRLANITVTKDAKSINASNITNLVGTEECPFVTGILQTASIEDLFLSWNEQFTNWFEKVQSQLSGDVAGALLLEINQRLHKVDDKASSADMVTLTDDTKWVSPAGLKPVLANTVDREKLVTSMFSLGFFAQSSRYFRYPGEIMIEEGVYVSNISIKIYDVFDRDLFFGISSVYYNGAMRSYFFLLNGRREILSTVNNSDIKNYIYLYVNKDFLCYSDENNRDVIYSVKIENGKFKQRRSYRYLDYDGLTYKHISYGTAYRGITGRLKKRCFIDRVDNKTNNISGINKYKSIEIDMDTGVINTTTYTKSFIDSVQRAFGLSINLYDAMNEVKANNAVDHYIQAVTGTRGEFILSYQFSSSYISNSVLQTVEPVNMNVITHFIRNDDDTITVFKQVPLEYIKTLDGRATQVLQTRVSPHCYLRDYIYASANVRYVFASSNTTFDHQDRTLYCIYDYDGNVITSINNKSSSFFTDPDDGIYLLVSSAYLYLARYQIRNNIFMEDGTEYLTDFMASDDAAMRKENLPSSVNTNTLLTDMTNSTSHRLTIINNTGLLYNHDMYNQYYNTTYNNIAKTIKYVGTSVPIYIHAGSNEYRSDFLFLIEKISLLGEVVEQNEVIVNDNS